MTGEYSVRELLLLAQNHIPPSQIALRDNIEGWLASHPASSALHAQNAELAAEAREKVAQWMIANSLATGHGDTIEDLLAETVGQIQELRRQNAELVAALERQMAHWAAIDKAYSNLAIARTTAATATYEIRCALNMDALDDLGKPATRPFFGDDPSGYVDGDLDEPLRAQNADAYGYAKRLLEAFVAEHFPPNPDWKPLPDLMGVLTQIDNASTIARDLCVQHAELVAALEEARRQRDEAQRAEAALYAENAELVAALKEARQRLAKGRALWNGPCHECDAVLAAALKDKP
jgi:hypothetical protein